VPIPAADIRQKVAVLVPLTGPNAGVGTSISNAAALALADTRADNILLTVYDTGKGAAAAAGQAIGDGNRLFLGPLLAEDARTIAPLARQANIPVISFSNDVSVAGDGVYIMGFTPSQSIDRVVSHARSQGAQRFAGLIPQGDYGARSLQALTRAVERSGGRLAGTQTFDRTPASLRSAVIRLNAQSAYDAVLIADNPRIATSAAATIRSGPSNGARILGTELWRGDTALTAAATMRGAWFAAAPEAKFDQLRTRYRARYGKTPYRLGSLGYDAVLLTVGSRASGGRDGHSRSGAAQRRRVQRGRRRLPLRPRRRGRPPARSGAGECRGLCHRVPGAGRVRPLSQDDLGQDRVEQKHPRRLDAKPLAVPVQ
jgi:ABC-type branched-subunit amino acid transport system substrate-binding protein